MRYVTVKPGFSKGDRVVVNLGTKEKPEYYMGTVKNIGSRLTITLDNDKEKVLSKDNVWKSDFKKKRKNKIPSGKVNKYTKKGKGVPSSSGGIISPSSIL